MDRTVIITKPDCDFNRRRSDLQNSWCVRICDLQSALFTAKAEDVKVSLCLTNYHAM
jgi:hypothetical protein